MAPAPPLPYTPPYPVINAQPTFFAVIKNMGIGDYARFFFGGALGAAWGFAAGKPVRRAGFWYMGATTASLCALASLRSSYHRLTGQRPNREECYIKGIPYNPPPGF